nr:MAG TPA: hypothetical protein [Siphoviridae sp. ctRJB2]
MTTLKSYDTPQLLNILNSRSGGMELVGTEFKNIDDNLEKLRHTTATQHPQFQERRYGAGRH